MVDDEDGLDSVFGGPEPTESVPAAQVNAKAASSKAQTRKQKRAQRRQRRKNREEASINNSTPQYERAQTRQNKNACYCLMIITMNLS